MSGGDPDVESAVRDPGLQQHVDPARFVPQTVHDGIFHQRLQDQRGQERGGRRGVEPELVPQAAGKAQLLDVEIVLQEVELTS